MNAISQLTELESKIIMAFNTNYKNAEDEKDDNATYTDINDLHKATGESITTIKGAVGSLVKKGLVEIDPPRNGAPQCFCLTDEGIDLVYSD